MQRNLLAIGIAALVALIIITNTVYIVRQDRQAIILRFGEYVGAVSKSRSSTP
jgi:regulator of protease activity HflC (stomatin/prohibitin superfamily)